MRTDPGVRTPRLLMTALVVVSVLVLAPVLLVAWLLVGGLSSDDPGGYVLPFAVIGLVTFSPALAAVVAAWVQRRCRPRACASLLLLASLWLTLLGLLVSTSGPDAGDGWILALGPGLLLCALPLAAFVRADRR